MHRQTPTSFNQKNRNKKTINKKSRCNIIAFRIHSSTANCTNLVFLPHWISIKLTDTLQERREIIRRALPRVTECNGMTNARGSSHVVVILRVNRELWRGRLISFLFPASPSDLNSIFYYVTGRLYTGKEEWDYHGYCGW